MISFTIHGDPKGQPRAKVALRGKFAHAYTPAGPHVAWSEQVVVEAQRHRPETPTERPVCVRLVFHLPRPKAHYNKAGLRADAPKLCSKKPDVDNLAKLILDRMTACGFWVDDSQVAQLVVEKWYAEDGKQPRCDVSVIDSGVVLHDTFWKFGISQALRDGNRGAVFA